MLFSYVSRDVFKTRMNITAGTPSDATLRFVIEGVSEAIDTHCHRQLLARLQTRYYTASRGNYLVVKDLVSVTSIKTDRDGDRTYEQTWEATDYDLLPFNAATDGEPYTEISVTPAGVLTFPTISKGVEIVGKWGYSETTQSAGTLGANVSDTTGTSVTMAAGHTVDSLHTLQIDSEQLYVTAVATNTLTVVRGVNGTDGATHSSGATVSEIVFPDQVREAAIIQTSRLYRRADAPFGVVGSDQYGTTMLRARLDPDVQEMLGRFRRPAVA